MASASSRTNRAREELGAEGSSMHPEDFSRQSRPERELVRAAIFSSCGRGTCRAVVRSVALGAVLLLIMPCSAASSIFMGRAGKDISTLSPVLGSGSLLGRQVPWGRATRLRTGFGGGAVLLGSARGSKIDQGHVHGLNGLKLRFDETFEGVKVGLSGMGDKVWGARLHLLAGALGRCVAVSVMFPVDTVKTRLQLHGANCCSPLQWSDALRRPLFRGVGSSLMGQVPNGMLVYGSYELYKREISERLPSLDTHHVRLLAALISDVTGSLWLAPFEGTKQRVQAGLFPSIRSAFTETFRDKGIAGLYAGYKAQVVRDIAFHMVQLPLYEAVRDAWVVGVQPLVGSRERHNAHAPMLSTWESLLCGALTGATSGAVTTPIDVVKTRLMARQVGVGNSSIRQAVVDILSREGLGGFSAGLAQRATYIACGSAIFFTVYEQVIHRMGPQLDVRATGAK